VNQPSDLVSGTLIPLWTAFGCLLIAGLILLVGGAELLVRGAASLAAAFKIGSRSEVLGAYSAAMLWFVLPLTLVTLLTVSLRAVKAK
jgi:Ca2+/Na+ antiporter